MELRATDEIGKDGVHENVTVTETSHEGTKVTKGCTITTTTDERGGKHFEVVFPDLLEKALPPELDKPELAYMEWSASGEFDEAQAEREWRQATEPASPSRPHEQLPSN